jgi:hypothetical protein
MSKKDYIVLVVLLSIAMGCRKPYNPPAINSPGSYLVIEGTINTSGVTTIKLDLAPLSSTAIPLNEFFANNGFEGYISASKECADCTVRGTAATSAYWQ